MPHLLRIAGVLCLAAAAMAADQPSARGGGAPGGAPKNAGKMANPSNPAAILLKMTAEERERFLERLPPADQVKFRQRLEQLDNLRPAEKERIIRQSDALSSLPPEKQKLVTRQIMALNGLPPERRVQVKMAVVTLHRLAEADRTARLNSPQFKSMFSPEEQQIIADLAQTLPADYPIGGPNVRAR
ncbi:MAG TPA: DUF3106 domain-containing protein [Bryobacteraceae bacterium]|nr:DUF3106 domain-containing protein [Bryobacteraceae bacterium]